MFRRSALRVSISLLLLAPLSVSATDVRSYEATKSAGSKFAEIYLTGAGQGLSLANVVLVQRGDRPLYCQPPKLALHGSNYTDIFEAQLKKLRVGGTFNEETPMEAVLLLALQETFPCK